MNRKEIIERIGYIRVRAKLTQKGLSTAVGMNFNYINRLESKGDFLPSLEVLMKIIEVCGSTPEEFFYHDISAYGQDRILANKIKSMPADVKEFLLDYDPDLMQLFTTLNRKYVKRSD